MAGTDRLNAGPDAPPRAPWGRRCWWAALCSSLAAHALLPWAWQAVRAPVPAAGPAAAVVHLRPGLAPATTADAPAPVQNPPDTPDGPGPAASAAAADPGPTTPAIPTGIPASSPPQAQTDDASYLPREALSVVPTLLNPVLLDVPRDVPDGRYRVELTLYIDELGGVRRAVVSAPDDTPPRLLEIARQAFLASLFRPGQREGRPARARLRVQVEFEADSGARAVGTP